ncbi:MAG: hypothetical protein IKT32_04625, partial [Clostridia bacterium]|nr:hypothetical protein [Clostridia bacterium]
MKIFRKIVLAVVLAVSILLPNFQVEVSAASYVYNWGERGVVATGLSNAAKSFYTGDYEYSVLSQYTGGSSQSNAPSSALYSQLKSFMTSKHKKIT